MHFLYGIPRSWWLSAGGGVSVAYVFLHLLPELSAGQDVLAREFGKLFGFIEQHIYLIALGGLAMFYGLERLAKASRRQNKSAEQEDKTSAVVFWIHVTSFAVYNFLIGYLLLHLETTTLRALTFFAVAMALHFVANDFALAEDHKERYHGVGRWILAVAVLTGWMAGSMTDISESTIAIITAFLAGGVVLNVLKEELPEERQSRFSAFVLGASGYAALLIISSN